ncbi:MAG: CD225/dispanin family protein [Acidobacteria bacterium]|nr:CD225/dispanin family protein [Acidobacteriota bacterium]
MQQPGMAREPERPPNYLVRAIILLVLLAPLCLLLGLSSAYAALVALTGPPVMSETPAWMRALMDLLRAVVGLIGFFMPIAALVQALKVNGEYNAGNYAGAEKASKTAGAYCRQSIIILVIVIFIMGVDLLRYLVPMKR